MTQAIVVACVVEGHGEVEAVPVLLRRVVESLAPEQRVDVPRPIRDAKGWLQDRRTDGRAYSPTIDQPALAAAVDVTLARTGAPSFGKLWREIECLVEATAS